MRAMVAHVIERGLPRHSILNVNLPDRPLAGFTGIRPARLGGASCYDYVVLARGRAAPATPPSEYLPLRAPAPPGEWVETDFDVVASGAVAVTPLRYDLLDPDLLADLAALGPGPGAPPCLSRARVGFDPVVFDLDGTVVDTVELIVESFRHATRTVLRRGAARRGDPRRRRAAAAWRRWSGSRPSTRRSSTTSTASTTTAGTTSSSAATRASPRCSTACAPPGGASAS